MEIGPRPSERSTVSMTPSHSDMEEGKAGCKRSEMHGKLHNKGIGYKKSVLNRRKIWRENEDERAQIGLQRTNDPQ